MSEGFRRELDRIDALLALALARARAGGGSGYTPPAGAEGDLLVFHGGVWETVIAPGAAGLPLTSSGPGALPSYQAIQKTPIGPLAFVDPANSTGFASDSNTGANSTNTPAGTGPILTTVHANGLLFNRSLTADRTVQYLSDDASGVALDPTTVSQGAFQLTIAGTPQTLHTGGTLNAGTIAINPAAAGGGQRQVVHTTDLASFAPFVPAAGGHLAYWLHDTSSNATAWIMSATTPASPSVSRPAIGNSSGAFTIGDGYTVQRGSVLSVMATQLVNFVDLELTEPGTGSDNLYTRCSIASPQPGSQYDNCFVDRPFVDGTITVNAGAVSLGANDKASIIASSDVYFTNDSLFIDPQHIELTVFAGFGAGIQVQDMTGGGLTILTSWDGSRNLVFGSGGLIWGNGNAAGVLVCTGAVASFERAQLPTVTGASGDFAFFTVGGGAVTQVARAVVVATGAYTEAGAPATRATTWANLAATIGAGGFGFQAHYAEGQAAVIGN